ncbi:LysM peptidoglycan-binding domain-containing protein [Aquibacillus koreensis]|uniref:LysM peptidoglycan-binding domain-containing protein n=1 Tax=Aquibacillus koreensis TaxID=279446 RepID=A0A9X3WIH1_9BACI|nr:LysM peptidoglycan-binding domain-containing protein [Aquibacillus koreensis]MCT2534826.1 LysM peptidoglycan-binding domain-containing protein [Aquibacillus koreensis]MDC3419563.1 LysM peptidoglycan-binding domain-containing protein [Aquibacillus koreensis]
MPIVNGSSFVYTVKQGDTLYSIASSIGGTVPLLVEANAIYPPVIDPYQIFPGQVLVISTPGNRQVNHIVSAGEALYQISRRYATSVDLLQGINKQITNPTLIYPNQMLQVPALIYLVEQGDTLYRIAQRFGVSTSILLEANQNRPGLSPDVIYPGYQLIVPLPTSNNIVVFQPLPGTTIQVGQTLQGYARAFEGAILYRIIDQNGQIVLKESPIQTAAGGPAYGAFSTSIMFDNQPTTQSGELWVYTRSPRDGSVQDLVAVRVMF